MADQKKGRNWSHCVNLYVPSWGFLCVASGLTSSPPPLLAPCSLQTPMCSSLWPGSPFCPHLCSWHPHRRAALHSHVSFWNALLTLCFCNQFHTPQGHIFFSLFIPRSLEQHLASVLCNYLIPMPLCVLFLQPQFLCLPDCLSAAYLSFWVSLKAWILHKAFPRRHPWDFFLRWTSVALPE